MASKPARRLGRPPRQPEAKRSNIVLDGELMTRVLKLARKEDRPLAAMLRRLVVLGLQSIEEAPATALPPAG